MDLLSSSSCENVGLSDVDYGPEVCNVPEVHAPVVLQESLPLLGKQVIQEQMWTQDARNQFCGSCRFLCIKQKCEPWTPEDILSQRIIFLYIFRPEAVKPQN
ncbi:hypothetical protein J6590_026324 [Homalodisca vitripennis]|nr:hypothetical protein J6590_026324 [Homalodisca vitripennis]